MVGGVGVGGFSGRNQAKIRRISPVFRLREGWWLLGCLAPSHGRLGVEFFAVLLSAIVRRGRDIFCNRVAGG